LAEWAFVNRYGSVTLQSGERTDDEFICYITNLINRIKQIGGGELGITLSLGEQTEDTYRRWFDAGAHRYLLRIETSNERLYGHLHNGAAFTDRAECLYTLMKIGYQTGTGVMVGLPRQTVGDLADDIIFFKESGVGMIGMGPYIVAEGTPTGDEAVALGLDNEPNKRGRLRLSLNMVAATRIILRDVNIASTTALHTLDPLGREKGLLAGANILMPVLTMPEYKRAYNLYGGKPNLDDDADAVLKSLVERVEAAGMRVAFGERGDSPRYV
jgi:biotin synthase